MHVLPTAAYSLLVVSWVSSSSGAKAQQVWHSIERLLSGRLTKLVWCPVQVLPAPVTVKRSGLVIKKLAFWPLSADQL